MTKQNPKTQKTLSLLSRAERAKLRNTAKQLLFSCCALSCSDDFQTAHSWACAIREINSLGDSLGCISRASHFLLTKHEFDEQCANLAMFLNFPSGETAQHSACHAVTTLPRLTQDVEELLPELLAERNFMRIHAKLIKEVHEAFERSVGKS